MRHVLASVFVSSAVVLFACGDSDSGSGGASSSSSSSSSSGDVGASTSSSSSGGDPVPPSTPNAGKVDPTFGANGIAKQGPAAFNFTPTTGVVLKDDRVIAVGYGNDNTGKTDLVIGKFTKDGALDKLQEGANSSLKFARTGAPDNVTVLVALEAPANRLVVMGSSQVASNPTSGFVQMVDLATNTTCGGFREAAGCYAVPNSTVFERPIAIGAIAFDAAGNVYTAGAGPVGEKNFIVTKLSKAGNFFPDTAWGDTTLGVGQAKVDFGGDEGVGLLSINADGTLLATGVTSAAASPGLVMARFTAAGAVDATFGAGGKASLGAPAERFIKLGDDKVLAVAHDKAGAKTVFARALPNGTLDPAFGTGGRASSAYPADANAEIVALHALADGRILVGYSDGSVGRFTAAGAIDTGWNATGFAKPAWPAGVKLTAVGVQSNGAVIAIGGRSKSGNPTDIELENAMFATRFQN